MGKVKLDQTEDRFYRYKAHVTKVVDADTIDVICELGMWTSISTRLRFIGINAPEKNTPEGKTAKEYLRNLIEGKDVEVQTYLDATEKYGRLLAVIYLPTDDPAIPMNVNQQLIKSGNAVFYDGGKR